MYALFLILGDDAMFGDAEHYKYLTNEADLNNANDDSIALTPNTPKKVWILNIFIIYLFIVKKKRWEIIISWL